MVKTCKNGTKYSILSYTPGIVEVLISYPWGASCMSVYTPERLKEEIRKGDAAECVDKIPEFLRDLGFVEVTEWGLGYGPLL
jgi:hypothetical protein